MPLIRYWAAARDAAGVAEETLPGSSLEELLASARAGRDERFGAVLAVASYLVDGVRVDRSAPLDADAVVEVLPPFAGG